MSYCLWQHDKSEHTKQQQQQQNTVGDYWTIKFDILPRITDPVYYFFPRCILFVKGFRYNGFCLTNEMDDCVGIVNNLLHG